MVNEIVTRSEKMTEKQLVNGIVKACDNIKARSYELCILVNRLYVANPSKETTDMLIEKTDLKKATISQMKKAGEFFIQNPEFSFLDYSKAYILTKLDHDELSNIDADEIAIMSQRELKEYVKEHSEDANKPCSEEDAVEDAEEDTNDCILYFPFSSTVREICANILTRLDERLKNTTMQPDERVDEEYIKEFIYNSTSEILGGC